MLLILQQLQKKVFQVTNTKPNIAYNGHNFFGLHRDDVQRLQRCSNQKVFINDLKETTENCASVSSVNRNVNWMGVVSLGIPYQDPLYKISVGRKTLRIQPGYEALRQLKQGDNVITVHCIIEASTNGPQFICKTKSEPPVYSSSHNISAVVTDVFSKLRIQSKKKWSGYEFFDLTKNEVLRVCMCVYKQKTLLKRNTIFIKKKKNTQTT